MRRALITHMARSIIARAGGVDAACAAIEAYTGTPVSRGTISKIQNGHLDFPFSHVLALQGATGDMSFARLLQREGQAHGLRSAMSHVEVLKETTEAVLAQASAEVSGDQETLAAAIKETEEAHAALGAVLERLLNRMGEAK